MLPPRWTELKKLHGPPAPKKNKKRKAVVKKGEKQTKYEEKEAERGLNWDLV
jgi:hypothetical protein